MTLYRSITPFPDESLSGLIARASSVNIYPRALDVLVQARTSGARPEAVATRDAELAAQLAKVLGTDENLVAPLFHRRTGGGKFIDFFGVRLRAVHRETVARRVSPRALRISPYVRAIWHLRPLSFDPATKEELLDRCPVCDGQLGFVFTQGVPFCDHCEHPGRSSGNRLAVDLRDYPQPVVELDDMEALDFVTGLLDPDPEVRAGFAPALHDDLAAFDRSDLFELALAIGTALMAEEDPDFQPSAERIYRANTRTIAPDALANAGRALLSWPNGYHGLLERSADKTASRSGQWGQLKDLGAFASLPRDAFLSPELKFVIALQNKAFIRARPVARDAVRRNGDRDSSLYVGAKQLRIESKVSVDVVTALGQHSEIVRYRISPPPAPVVFARMSVEPIIRRYKDLISEESAAFNIGVPIEVMEDFETALYIRRVDGMEAQFSKAKVNYSTTALESLFGHYHEIAPDVEKSDDIVPFTDVMLMFPSGRRPWFALWEQILWGNVDSGMHRERKTSLTDTVCVRASQIDLKALAVRMSELSAPERGNVTIGSARLTLGIQSYPVFTAAVAGGIFKLNTDKTLPYDQVQDFARQFILVNEIGMRSGVGRHKVRGWLEDNGVLPARDLGVKGGLLYERGQLEQLLSPPRRAGS